MNTATELREQTSDELRAMQRDLVRELWKARFDNHTNQLDDTSKIKKLRRRIARVNTILTERDLEKSNG
jgi:large subunit ribosomal protein L29